MSGTIMALAVMIFRTLHGVGALTIARFHKPK